jgi:hypothetical protein
MRTTVCGMCLWLVAAVCSAAGPFDGKVAGSIAIQGGGQSPIEWGMVKGDVIVFKLKMPFQDRTETFVYLGKMDGEQIAFGRRPENLTIGQLVEFMGTRGK